MEATTRKKEKSNAHGSCSWVGLLANIVLEQTIATVTTTHLYLRSCDGICQLRISLCLRFSGRMRVITPKAALSNGKLVAPRPRCRVGSSGNGDVMGKRLPQCPKEFWS